MSFQPLAALGHVHETAAHFLKPVEFRTVRSSAELKSAMQLVYREYVARGYLTPNPAELKLSIYNALVTTTTLVAVHHSVGVIATVSLIQDSPLGLPMDEVYKAELDDMRRDGHRLAEASMLALDSRLFGGRRVFTLFHPKKMFLTLRLFKALFDYLRVMTKADELVACFNPKHQSLYDLLHMQPLGSLKTYSSANGHPAIAKRFNVVTSKADMQTSPILQFLYSRTPSTKRYAGTLVLSAEELRELFVRTAAVFASASPTELEHVRQGYPAYDFEQILRGEAPAMPSEQAYAAPHR
jgi:hypothetical protein